jgi:leucyl aminopeptidase
MEIEVSISRAGEADVQAIAVPVFKNEKADEGLLRELDEAMDGLIRAVIESEELTGKEGETALLHLVPNKNGMRARRVLLVGVGAREDYRAPQVAQMAGTAARSLRAKNVKTLAVVMRANEGDEMATAACVEGVAMSLFDTDKYRTSEREERSIKRLVVIASGDETRLRAAAERGRIIADGVNFARDLANEPGLTMTPTILAERAAEVAEKFGLEIDVLDEARMEAEGMGALLCVSRGSEEPAKMIVLKYTPEGYEHKEGDELLTFVGKGLTFDSGGISIKPAENMELMKYDMCGGAAVIGAMHAIAQLKPSMPVLGVVPSSENMVSGKAIKPGDVVRAMSGKTIEVINTDAEGRLILADALCYARKLGATRIIDMATLTGAVVVALGDVNSAVLGTNQELIDEIIAAGHEVGERYWQMPLDKEYSKQIKSDIADIKNIGGRKAGTITAAAFLKEFVEDVPWAHLDIAGTAWADDAKPYRVKGATGVAVRTLVQIVKRTVDS